MHVLLCIVENFDKSALSSEGDASFVAWRQGQNLTEANDVCHRIECTFNHKGEINNIVYIALLVGGAKDELHLPARKVEV